MHNIKPQFSILQRKIQREMQKRTPKINKVMKWQEKSVKYVNRGLRYMNEIDAQSEDNCEQTEISFNLEKVYVYNFGQMINVSTSLGGANGKRVIVIEFIFIYRSQRGL